MISSRNSFEKFRIDGRSAIITGGAGLLGIQHASALLEAGGNVILWDINLDKLNTAKSLLSTEFTSSNVEIEVVDVSDELQVTKALSNVGTEISILVNNASINPKYGGKNSDIEFSRLENFEIANWDRELAVGLTSAFLCSKIIGTSMAKNNSGVILNVASDLSIIGPDQRLYELDGYDNFSQPVKPITYSVIKAGLIGLTRYLATYWNKSGVRVNAISPGGVYENQPEEFVSRLSKLIPLGRMAEAEEYRSAIQFLCSDASNYMTGHNLVMDGGRSVW